jgi:urate oxidase
VALVAGVTQLETAIRDTRAAAITYQRDASKKTFTEQYGPSIAQVMYNLCNVANNDHLPKVHRLLAQSPKG